MKPPVTIVQGTQSSVVLESCQICDHRPLETILFLGYLPPVNQMRPIGELPQEQPAYPALWLRCPRCTLVQLGLAVDPNVLFPPDYPYTSGTTKILRENFAALYAECQRAVPLSSDDLVVDIGSNDGTLLSNFKNGGQRVHGIEPTDMGRLAARRGIPTTIAFFGRAAADAILGEHGKAKVITATSVFAHVQQVHEVVRCLLTLLDDRGVFISESHYLMSLMETLQYDTIYHEHLRYYSLTSLQYLLEMHGLQVIRATRIPTHGGSIRVYAARKGVFPPDQSVGLILQQEADAAVQGQALSDFKWRVVASKLRLHRLLADIRAKRHRVFGIGAPSRASTLINYTGMDDGILDSVLEIQGSYKIGKYMPGTLIPVQEESRLWEDQPEYAMLLSWHIAEELIPKLRDKGFKGRFIIPLPEPRVCD